MACRRGTASSEQPGKPGQHGDGGVTTPACPACSAARHGSHWARAGGQCEQGWMCMLMQNSIAKMGTSQLSTTTGRTREGCSGSCQANHDVQEDGAGRSHRRHPKDTTNDWLARAKSDRWQSGPHWEGSTAARPANDGPQRPAARQTRALRVRCHCHPATQCRSLEIADAVRQREVFIPRSHFAGTKVLLHVSPVSVPCRTRTRGWMVEPGRAATSL